MASDLARTVAVDRDLPPAAVDSAHWRLRTKLGTAAALVLLALFSTVLLVGSADSTVVLYIDDLTQLLAAAAACAGATVASLGTWGRIRLAWAFTAAGCGSWAVGQGIWCSYELVRHTDVPSLSLADPFFLLFPIAAGIGLSLYSWADRRPQRWRRLLDGVIAAAALFVISWSSVLRQVAGQADSNTLANIVNLAYPAGDILVLTVVVLSLGRTGARTATLWLVAGSMTALAVSDSCFVYLGAVGQYQTGTLMDAGWVAGFLLLGVTGLLEADPAVRLGPHHRPAERGGPNLLMVDLETSRELESSRVTMLPYLVLAVATVVVVVLRLVSGSSNDVANGALIIAMIAVLARQYVTVRDNRALVAAVAAREEQLQHQAFSDQLTGLANRALFTDRVAHALELHAQSLRPVALLFVDLDDFKAVNDTLGHATGDQLLVRVAERIRGNLRNVDTLARFGGDEFAVLVEDGPDAVQLGAHIVEMLRVPFSLATGPLAIRASIGVTEVGAGDSTPSLDELFSRADIAMYAAKRAGKGQLALYESTMVLPEAADLLLRPALTKALAEGTVTAVFQPIVNLATGHVQAVEALARWQHGDEEIAQDYFIQLAGRSGLLPALTDLMLHRACAQLQDWSDRLGLTELHVSVNVPPGLISDPDFPGRVFDVLSSTGLRPDRLVLEITEDALLGDARAARVVANRLREFGVGLALDDFGTGYSSLLSLRQIPLQSVKIDIAFVATIDRDEEAKRFLRALLALGRDLQLSVTAEGVERQEQASILRALGCQYAQGFLFARPVPPADLEPMLLRRPAPVEGSPSVDGELVPTGA